MRDIIMMSKICVQKDMKKTCSVILLMEEIPPQTRGICIKLPVNHVIFSISTGIQLVQDFFHQQYWWI